MASIQVNSSFYRGLFRSYLLPPNYRELIPFAQTLLDSDCTVKKGEIAEYLRPSTTPASGLVAYSHPSRHMIDYDANRLSDVDKFHLSANKIGTTRELFAGTTKATEQLPGYCGHIPSNTYNLVKEEHSSGRHSRPQTCYLRLVSERLGSVPNYTGESI
jgi:hypothetical protein